MSRNVFLFVLIGGFLGYAAKVLPNSHLKDLVQSVFQHHDPDGSKTRISKELVMK
jgi:hypothetical protein